MTIAWVGCNPDAGLVYVREEFIANTRYLHTGLGKDNGRRKGRSLLRVIARDVCLQSS